MSSLTKRLSNHARPAMKNASRWSPSRRNSSATSFKPRLRRLSEETAGAVVEFEADELDEDDVVELDAARQETKLTDAAAPSSSTSVAARAPSPLLSAMDSASPLSAAGVMSRYFRFRPTLKVDEEMLSRHPLCSSPVPESSSAVRFGWSNAVGAAAVSKPAFLASAMLMSAKISSSSISSFASSKSSSAMSLSAPAPSCSWCPPQDGCVLRSSTMAMSPLRSLWYNC